MNIAIEDYAEDALVALLKGKLPGEVDLRPAYLVEPVRYPAVIVAVTGNGNNGTHQSVTAPRALTIEVQLITEYKNLKDKKTDALVMTSREMGLVLRRAVTRILAQVDLVEQLNASPDVIFSTCFMGEIRRGNAGTEIETVIPLEAIAVARNQEP